jgi:nucleoside-diphosphate-sugar epimerase
LGEDVSLDALDGADVLVHAAYDFDVRSWADIRRVNVSGSERLFDAATRAGVEHQVFISSLAAYEGCRSKYGLGKLAAEEAARARGGIVVRPGVIYSEENGGLAAKIAAAARKLTLLPMIGTGRYPLYMCHVDDLVCLIMELVRLDRPPFWPIIAAHPERITLRKLAESARMSRTFGAIVPIPWFVLFFALWSIERFGIRLAFRSDSIVSLVQTNPEVNFSSQQSMSVKFRPFLPPPIRTIE